MSSRVAVGALKGALRATVDDPDGRFLAGLNPATDARAQYFALASNFEPTAPGFKAFVTGRVLDAILKTDNDPVAPTSAVYDRNGSSLFRSSAATRRLVPTPSSMPSPSPGRPPQDNPYAWLGH